jgi:flagellar P-ring protein precursor FlgI
MRSVILAAALCVFAAVADAANIRDIARVMGVRDNQLVGYGIVIGLQGTGDRPNSGYTERAMSNLLQELGLSIEPDDLRMRNVAAVLVTATLPPFAREGAMIDVVVSSVGSAKSLRGGVLVQTPLRAGDGLTYAVAQGPLSTGGYESSSPGGSRIRKNHVTVGRVPNGGLVEREVSFELFERDTLDIVLDRPDFRTAADIALVINQRFGYGTAVAADPGTVRVPRSKIPTDIGIVGFAADVEDLNVSPARPARVVINERTGTVVAGGDIQLAPAAIAHGGLTIEVQNVTGVSQPRAFNDTGETVVLPQSTVNVTEGGRVVATSQVGTLSELADALNELGVTTGDIIAIFQALKEVGALDAELRIQ